MRIFIEKKKKKKKLDFCVKLWYAWLVRKWRSRRRKLNFMLFICFVEHKECVILTQLKQKNSRAKAAWSSFLESVEEGKNF